MSVDFTWTERLLGLLGTAQCRECEEWHEASFSHHNQFDGARVYAVVCTRDGLTDYYTQDVVEVVERIEHGTRSTKRLALKHIARSYGLPDRWQDDRVWTGDAWLPTQVRWSTKRDRLTGKYVIAQEVRYS